MSFTSKTSTTITNIPFHQSHTPQQTDNPKFFLQFNNKSIRRKAFITDVMLKSKSEK